MDTIQKKIIGWFEATNAENSYWQAKIVYEDIKTKSLVAKTFSNEVEAREYAGYTACLRDMGIPHVTQEKGFDLWYFYGGKVPYKVDNWANKTALDVFSI